jgi:hypothetical protein
LKITHAETTKAKFNLINGGPSPPVWKIKRLEKLASSKVDIYDRFQRCTGELNCIAGEREFLSYWMNRLHNPE